MPGLWNRSEARLHNAKDSNRIETNAPLVSVIICTCDRGDNVVHTARAVLASDHPNLEVFILDQSAGEGTHESIRSLCDANPRLRYVRLSAPGKATALNHALGLVKGPYVALTDDDCEPDSQWIPALLASFQHNPRVACVFGTVVAAPYNEHEFYLPVCPIPESFTVERVADYVKRAGMHNAGLGANMALKREIVADLNGWDPCSGPGEKFASGDDYSLAIRILCRGHAVHFCKEACVTHFGFRRHEQIGRDSMRWGIGLGATFAKYLRCGVVARHSLSMFLEASRHTLGCVLRFRRPFQSGLPRGWLRGFFSGLFHPLDKSTLCFRAVTPAQTQASGLRVRPELRASVVLRAEQLHASESSPDPLGSEAQ